MKSAALLLGILLLPGCFIARTHVDQPIDPAAVSRLQPGTTTAAEVVELLGAPREVLQLGRRSAYRFQHDQVKTEGLFLLVLFLANRDSQADRTWVFFDENDVLTHVGTTLDADKAEYRMPWSSID